MTAKIRTNETQLPIVFQKRLAVGCPFLVTAAISCLAISAAMSETAVGMQSPKNLLQNPGFEEMDTASIPIGWERIGGRPGMSLTDQSPHGGKTAVHVVGDGQSVSWRQEVADLPTRSYIASGWFRANKLQINPADASKESARFYCHILYKDRPYSDATHVFADIPPGTYDWRLITVRLVPKTQWAIEKVRVSVVTRLSGGSFDFDDLSLAAPPLRSGAFTTEWCNGDRPTVITDMRLCTPNHLLSDKEAMGRWQLIDYEAGGMKGKMAWASEEAGAPPLSLSLKANGWHAIYVGLADPYVHQGSHALLRLTNDPSYVPRTLTATSGQIEEVFFKVADLNGQSLHIAQESGGMGQGCGIAYVKLVSLTPEEVATVKADREDTSCRKLATTIDGFSFLYHRRPTSVEALLPEVESYRHSDFDTLILQVGGADLVNYPSKVGNMMGQGLTVFPRRGDRFYAEAIGELAAKSINPTKVLIEGAQSAGLKVHVGIRMGAWTHTAPFSDFYNSRFYQEHPEWRCTDRDGTPVARMSLAVPQVRLHLVEVLREAVRLGADGASILYNRDVPVVLFEKPFCDLFRQRHDIDPLSLPEDEKRILQLRAELVTTFMHEVRAMLDDEGQRRSDGKHLSLSAFLMADEADNISFGFNLRDWVAQGLVDEIFPYLHAGRAHKASRYDMKFFAEVCRPKNVRVRPTFIAWKPTDLNTLKKQALDLYDSGANGITAWDGNSIADHTDRWSVISRMGHVEELRQSADSLPPAPVTTRFQKLGELKMDGRYGPNWGY